MNGVCFLVVNDEVILVFIVVFCKKFISNLYFLFMFNMCFFFFNSFYSGVVINVEISLRVLVFVKYKVFLVLRVIVFSKLLYVLCIVLRNNGMFL